MAELEFDDSGGTTPALTFNFSVKHGKKQKAQLVLVYGTGGIGKSSLAALAPKPRFIDLDQGTAEFDCQRVEPEGQWTFAGVRAALAADIWKDCGTVVIDSVTKLEELIERHVIENIPHEKGQSVSSIEDYGFGKGYKHLFDQYLLFLADIQAHIRAGRHVILIAHDCISTCPNPGGEDYIRFEPRLQDPKKGTSSIRLRTKEECDHVLFLGYDIAVDSKSGKARGSGTRTVHFAEMPTHMAKSRSARKPMPFREGDGAIWSTILKEK